MPKLSKSKLSFFTNIKSALAIGLTVTLQFFLAQYTLAQSEKTSQYPDLGLSGKDKLIFQKHLIELPKTALIAEDFKGKGFNEVQDSLAKYQGKFVVLNFWATWCVPCLKELPDLELLYKKIQKKNAVVLAVAMGEAEETIAAYLQKHPLTMPIMVDPLMEISQVYRVANLPVTYLISPNGVVLGRALGPRDWANPGLIETFISLAQKK